MPDLEEAGARITSKALHGALKQRYPQADSDLPEMDEQRLLQVIARLQIAELEGSPIVDHIASEDPGFHLHDGHYATIAFLDECCRAALGEAEFSPAIQGSLRSGMPSLIRAAIVEGLITVSKGHGVLDVMDQLIDVSIGWTEKSDKLLTKIKELIESSIASLSMISESQLSTPQVKKSRDKFLADLCADIAKFSTKEQDRIAKLEERLVASETGLLKTNRARNLAAQMLNEKMAGKSLPQDIVDFLQGPWYDSLQLLLVRQGTQGEDWARASKLTETLIWTLEFNAQQQEVPSPTGNESSSADVGTANDSASDQESDTDAPDSDDAADRAAAAKQANARVIAEQQRLYRIIEHLPDELNELLVSLEYQDDSQDNALAAIDAALVGVMTGEPLENCSHEPLPCDVLGKDAAFSQSLLSQVNKINTGQWFVFEPQDQPPQQIKLVLKLDDMQQLLFTNRSGIKVLQSSFDEFAYFMSSEFARPISTAKHLSSIVRTTLHKIGSDYLKHQKSAEAAKTDQDSGEAAKRIAQIQAMREANRKKHAEKEEKEMASTQVFLAAVKEKSNAPENQAALKEAAIAVSKLNTGAWVRIPGPGREPTESKLAVKLQALDKYIFVNRAGIKLGVFTEDQLIDMLVTNECEILDSGTEVEDTLVKTVIELRKSRSLAHDNQ